MEAKQLIDINVSVSVTDFITDEYRNRITGSRMHAPFPAGLVNDVNYGPSIKAFAFLLKNYYNVSINKTRQCISDITNGIVNISDGTIANLSEAFSAAADEYTLHPPSKEYMDGYNLHLKLSKYQKEHLLFLTHLEIDCTNNISERELRKFKRKQKQAVVLRSDHGGQRICAALTIIETARMQKKNIYAIAAEAFGKTNRNV